MHSTRIGKGLLSLVREHALPEPTYILSNSLQFPVISTSICSLKEYVLALVPKS